MIASPRNTFKQRLLAGDIQIGLWLSLASPVSTEALSLVGFDWLMIDSEHSPIEVASIQPLLQAAAASTAGCIARPAWNDKVLIKKMLDIGVQTILVPFVQSAAEAAAAVAATRYPPDGIRGVAGSTRASRYGLARNYLKTANDEICVLVQIETQAGLDELEHIAAVPGVDGIFIGPSDLSASMGYLGNPSAPEVQSVLRQSARRIAATGKAPGILAGKTDDALRYGEWGYRFIAGAVDTGLLTQAAQQALERLGSLRPL